MLFGNLLDMQPISHRRTLPVIAALLLFSLPSLCFAQRGDISPVHDPAIIAAGARFYVFSTGRGIPIRQSDDLFSWRVAGRVFDRPALPDWSAAEIPGARGIWAPDIHHVGDEFRLYYAVSTLGSRRSAIGLAINSTLDSSRPAYRWRDRGKVIETTDADNYNAIDPDLIIDKHGRQWLFFGSFWSGIKARRIDEKTGMLSSEDATLYSIARRPSAGGAIEGAFVIHHGDFYYLFVSFDVGVRGVKSTYNVRAGRSQNVLGPYIDRAGRAMLAGGGTLLLCSYAGIHGPGHCGIVQTSRGDFFANHFYDAEHPWHAAMQIRPLLWDHDGWPVVAEPITAPLSAATTRPAQAFDPRGAWMDQIGFHEPVKITLEPGGKVIGLGRLNQWQFHDGTLLLRGPDHAMQDCLVDPTGNAFIGRTEDGALVRTWRIAK